MSCKALNAMGSGSQSSLLECMQFVNCPTGPNGEEDKSCSKIPHIVSNSWGSNSDEVGKEYEDAISSWIKSGIVPVFANGNSGDGCETTGSPGASKQVISVGATDDKDNIASFSSRGPVKASGLIKPEVSAPGVDVESAHHRNKNDYTKMSGTSMACPHVAGLAALMMQQYAAENNGQRMSYEQLKEDMLKYTVRNTLTKNNKKCPDNEDGIDDSVFPNNAYGYGRVDSLKLLLRDDSG